MFLHIELEAVLDRGAEPCVRASRRQHQADLDRSLVLRLGGDGSGAERGGGKQRVAGRSGHELLLVIRVAMNGNGPRRPSRR